MKTITKKVVKCLLLLAVMIFGNIVRADTPVGYSALETITYEYDASGNRIVRSATVAGTPESPIEVHYDLGSRLTQLTIKGQGSSGSDIICTLAYDANGQLITKSCKNLTDNDTVTTQYTWDARGRITRIQSSAGLDAAFKYDALGRRVERTVNGDTLQYLYDGNQAIAELKNEAISTHLLTGLQIDEIIARYSTQGERTLLTDALGSILITTREDATVATAYGYSPYGETQVMGASEQSSIQYTARENDDIGLYYYRARYYDPLINRFLSEDPIGIKGGVNLYSYVDGNPISHKDPSGLTPDDDDFPTPPPEPTNVCEAPKPQKPKPPGLCDGKTGQEKCECEYRIQLATCGAGIVCIMNAKRKLEACILGDDIENYPRS